MTTTPSGELQFSVDYRDQTAIFDPAQFAERVTVIGCGGIGGTLLPILVTMGVRSFRLYDPDFVDPRNVGGGLLYEPPNTYQLKVEVAAEFLRRNGATDVLTHQKLFVPGDELDSVVISGVDSMDARQSIWPAVRDSRAQIYLDGRIGGLQWTLLAVEPFDGEWYERRWLPDESKVAPLPCAARNVVFVSTGLAAEIGSHLARFSRGERLPQRVERHYGNGDFFQVIG